MKYFFDTEFCEKPNTIAFTKDSEVLTLGFRPMFINRNELERYAKNI